MTGNESPTGLRTIALLKQVPGLDHDGTLDSDGRLLRAGAPSDINPWCRRALAHAIRLASNGGECTAVTMGPPSARAALQEAQACGADRLVHLCDPILAASDCLQTARGLADVVKHLSLGSSPPPDLILVGRSTIDGNTAVIGAMLAEYLDLPFIGSAITLEVEDGEHGRQARALLQNEAATETVVVQLPAVVAVAERSCDPAKSPPSEWPDGSDIQTLDSSVLSSSGWGVSASPTRVCGVRRAPLSIRPAHLLLDANEYVSRLGALFDTLVDQQREPRDTVAGPPETTMSEIAVSPSIRAQGPRTVIVSSGQDPAAMDALVLEGRWLADRVGGHVVVVAPHLARDEQPGEWSGIDGRVILDHIEPALASATIDRWLKYSNSPWAILGTPMSWDREVLSRLAVRTGSGLLSDLTGLSISDKTTPFGQPRLIGLKNSGPGVIAEVAARGSIQVATLRTGSFTREYVVPSLVVPWTIELSGRSTARVVRSGKAVENDYEALERARIVIGVGQGVHPVDYPLLEEFRQLLGAEFAATRKVTDRGWMPHARQVGVTARDISPDLYIAIGISGNPNHMMGVGGAGLIIAINSDPEAPILTACDLGIVADWRDVVENLSDRSISAPRKRLSAQI